MRWMKLEPIIPYEFVGVYFSSFGHCDICVTFIPPFSQSLEMMLTSVIFYHLPSLVPRDIHCLSTKAWPHIWKHLLLQSSLCSSASLVFQLVKNLPGMWENWVQFLGWEDPLEKGKVTHSSILAWRIPWTKFMESQRVGHDWATFMFTFYFVLKIIHRDWKLQVKHE